MNPTDKAASELSQLLGYTKQVQVGRSRGVRADGSVNISLPGGGSKNVLAGDTCPSGSRVAFFPAANVAVSGNDRAVVREQVVRDVKVRPQPKQQTNYKIKVLFYKFENGVYNYYIGGDRKVPIKIYTSEDPIEDIGSMYLANTGRGKNDWVASFALGYDQNFTARTDIVYASGTYRWTIPGGFPKTIGNGWWTDEISGNNAYFSNTSCQTTQVTEFPQLGDITTVVDCTTTYFLSLGIPSGFIISGSGSSHTENMLDDPNEGQIVVSKIEASSNLSVTSKGYFFDKQEVSENGSYTETFNQTYNKPLNQPGTGITIFTTTDNIPVFVHKSVTKSYTYNSNSIQTIGSEDQSTVIIQNILAAIASKNSYLFFKENSTTINIGITGSTTIEKNLILGQKNNDTWQETSIIYNPIYDSLTADYGATLQGNKYYLVAPSVTPPITTPIVYATNLWEEKTITEYQSLNIYDNPTLGGKPKEVPVWVAEISSGGVSVEADVMETVYPLPSGSTVVSASYFP